MPLIERCVCGARWLFVSVTAPSGLELRRCRCGVIHRYAEISREEYEEQYRGDYHTSTTRHEGCKPYRDRYDQDRKVAAARWSHYQSVLYPVSRALDVGCANGAFVDYLRSQGVDAIGVDPDPYMARAHVITGTLAAVAGTFDLITMHDVLEHFVDPRAELAQARRLLAPGGRVVVDVPDVSMSAGDHHLKPEHLWHFTEGALVDLLGGAGLYFLGSYRPIPGKLVVSGSSR